MKAMASKSRGKTMNFIKYGCRTVSIGAAVWVMLLASYASTVWAQSNNTGLTFEVDVATGSGSKPKDVSVSELPLSAAPGSDSSINTEPPNEKMRPLYAALDQWHNQAMSGYRYTIGSLEDPFLPIEAVRGTQPPGTPGGGGGEDDILPGGLGHLDISQLKLVAITILSNRPGGALASFEDGAGTSYIMRHGDRIGRKKGKIIKIEQSMVVIEEPGSRPGVPSVITEKKLNVLDSSTGVTRSAGANSIVNIMTKSEQQQQPAPGGTVE